MKTRTPLLLAATVAMGALVCAGASAEPQSRTVAAQAAAQKIFHGKGKVTGVNAAAGLVTIAHEDIPGLMDAMEMQFEAKPAKLLEGLKAGDKVEFAIDGKTYTLLEISRTAR
jgi:Cu/Ag efflux protein CusF